MLALVIDATPVSVLYKELGISKRSEDGIEEHKREVKTNKIRDR